MSKARGYYSKLWRLLFLFLLLAHGRQVELEKTIHCRPDALHQALETVIQAARKSIPQRILEH
jgi:hypothetical protein